MAIADTIQSMYENVGEVYDTITNVEVNNGTNLLDYSTCKIGDLNTGTGAEEPSTVRIISDFVEVTPNENYICTLIGGDYTTYYYKSDKTFISGGSSWIGSGNSFTTPNNTGYLRLKFKNTNNTTISLNDLSNVMLNKGSTALPYQPYTDNPTYKNIQNIPSTMRSSYLEIMNNGIDKIWNNWEKVTGEGETLTLNSTEEAPMKINLKGNTSQATSILPSEYTQVDYIQSSGTQYIDTGYIFKSAKEKIDFKYAPLVIENARVCGSYTSGHKGMIIQPRQDSMAEVGQLSITPTFTITANTNYDVMLEANNGSYSFTFGNDSMTGTYNNDPITNRSHYLFNTNFSGTATKASMKLYYYKMYDNDVLVRDYVPCYRNSDNEIGMYDLVNNVFYTNAGTGAFTYGAVATLPNPNYPQDIHVVSGDNSIDVCGKNLWGEEEHGGIDESTGVDFYNATRWRTVGFISAQPNTSYTISSNASSSIWYIFYYYDKNKNFISSKPLLGTTSVNWETPSNCEYMRCVIADTASITTTQRQLELGNQSTTYEAYKGASYPINLGKNLFIPKPNNSTSAGILYSLNEDGTINLSGTSTNVIYFTFDKNVSESNFVNGNTYTFSSNKTIPSGVVYKIEIRSATSWLREYTISNSTPTRTFTIDLTDAVSIRYDIQVNNGTTPNLTNVGIQIEAGSQATSFSPYFTPIELCKIGDYQDSIKKSTGKNLFDKNNVEQIKDWFIYNNKLEARTNTTLFFVKCKPSTQYTITKISSTRLYFCCSVEKPAIGLSVSDPLNLDYNFTGTTKTVTTTSDAQWLICYYYNASSDTKTEQEIRNSIMLNEGSTALPYEPYGKVWYLNKQIGKLVLDGSESWTYTSVTQGSLFRNSNDIINNAILDDNYTPYCNYYKGIPRAIMRANNNIICNVGSNYHYLDIVDNRYTNADDFKAWLSTHNAIVYYVLATPTYTEITDSTLLSQLEALNGAKSYTTQTNINQENNDLPFILDVTALKELTQ